jgi:hypothetical protein
MKLYRFSLIQSKEELLAAIKHVHIECHKLCYQSFGKYLPVVKDIGIFCHYDEEYLFLTKLKEELTDANGNIDNKYFRLHTPIIIPQIDDIPEATYTYLYIRKPDPYRSQVGDIDFYLEPNEYQKLKEDIQSGKSISGARTFERAIPDMIELFDPDIDALGYVCPEMMPV